MRLRRQQTLHKVVCGFLLSCLLVYCECESGAAAASAKTSARRTSESSDQQSAPETMKVGMDDITQELTGAHKEQKRWRGPTSTTTREPPEVPMRDSGQIIREQDAEENINYRNRFHKPNDRYVMVGVQTLGGENLPAGPVYAAEDRGQRNTVEEEEDEGEEEDDTQRDLQEVQCPKPEAPEHGHVRGSEHHMGSQVYFYCDPGYHLTGPSLVTCLPVPDPFHHVGIWEPQTTPQCVPDQEEEEAEEQEGEPEEEEEPEEAETTEMHVVQCPKPEAPENGHVKGTEYYIGAQVEFFCDPGYSVVGPELVTCIGVPDPFHHVAIWDPPTKPRCLSIEGPPSTLPLVLVPHPSMSRASDTLGHRNTVAEPSVDEIEGLPTVCSLPKVTGPCKAAIPKYFFNSTLRECSPFTYGGCHGNDNNFETYEDCQNTCG